MPFVTPNRPSLSVESREKAAAHADEPKSAGAEKTTNSDSLPEPMERHLLAPEQIMESLRDPVSLELVWICVPLDLSVEWGEHFSPG